MHGDYGNRGGGEGVKWYVQVLTEMNYTVRAPVVVHVDNQSAMRMSENDIDHDRSKHIDIKHHFVRELINNKEVALRWVTTTDQLADIFTKALVGVVFKRLRERIMSSLERERDECSAS